MNAATCRAAPPSFGPTRASCVCVREPEHLGDHRNARGETWSQLRVVDAEQLQQMMDAYRADPAGFKVHDRRNW